MNLQETVESWFELASEGRIERADSFFRFVAVWIAFNVLYTSRHSDDAGDWNQVRSFAGEAMAIDRHRHLLEHDADYGRAIGILRDCGVYDVQSGRRWRIHDTKYLTSVVNCLYQVRCNLFHGVKMPEDPRDERLVAASYTIVSQLIKPYLTGGFVPQR